MTDAALVISARESLEKLNVISVDGIVISLVGEVTTDGSEYQYFKDLGEPSSVITT